MHRRSVARRSRRVRAAFAIALLGAGIGGSSAGSAAADPGASPGTLTASPPATATLAGTIMWNATTTARISPDLSEVWDVRGTMDLVLDDEGLGMWMSLPGRSTYAYDLEHVGCSPATHQEGTLESSIGDYPDDGRGSALVSGAIGADQFDVYVAFDDEWLVTCPGASEYPEQVSANAFPGCSATESGKMTATIDAPGSYLIACDIATDIGSGGIVVTGRIEGTLAPVAAP